MSAYNLLIPFISVCCCCCCCWCMCVCVRAHACLCMRVCLSKTDGDGWLCLCVGNESISFTPVSSPDRGGRAPRTLVASLSPSSFVLSLSLFVFSHVLVAFCHYCSLSHLSHTLPVSFFASYLYIVSCYLCLPTYSLSISIFGCFLLFCLFLYHQHSLRIHFNLSFTPSFPMYLLCLHLVSFTVYQTVHSKSHCRINIISDCATG